MLKRGFASVTSAINGHRGSLIVHYPVWERPLSRDVITPTRAATGLFSHAHVASSWGSPRGRVISGDGYNRYVQFPWPREIGGGWSLSSMFTQFWFAGQKSCDLRKDVCPGAGSWNPRRFVCRIRRRLPQPRPAEPTHTPAVSIDLLPRSKSIFTQASD